MAASHSIETKSVSGAKPRPYALPETMFSPTANQKWLYIIHRNILPQKLQAAFDSFFKFGSTHHRIYASYGLETCHFYQAKTCGCSSKWEYQTFSSKLFDDHLQIRNAADILISHAEQLERPDRLGYLMEVIVNNTHLLSTIHAERNKKLIVSHLDYLEEIMIIFFSCVKAKVFHDNAQFYWELIFSNVNHLTQLKTFHNNLLTKPITDNFGINKLIDIINGFPAEVAARNLTLLIKNMAHIETIYTAVTEWIERAASSAAHFELIMSHAPSMSELKWFFEKHPFFTGIPDRNWEGDENYIAYLSEEEIAEIKELFNGEQGEKNLKAVLQQCAHAKKIIIPFHFIVDVTQENFDLLLSVAAYADNFTWYGMNEDLGFFDFIDEYNVDVAYLIKNVQHANSIAEGWRMFNEHVINGLTHEDDDILEKAYQCCRETLQHFPQFAHELSFAIATLIDALYDEEFDDEIFYKLWEEVKRDPQFSDQIARAKRQLMNAELTLDKKTELSKRIEDEKKYSGDLVSSYLTIETTEFLAAEVKEVMQNDLLQYPSYSSWLTPWFLMTAHTGYLMNEADKRLREGLRLEYFEEEIRNILQFRVRFAVEGTAVNDDLNTQITSFTQLIRSYKQKESKPLIDASMALAEVVSFSHPKSSIRKIPVSLVGNIASFFSLKVAVVNRERANLAERIFNTCYNQREQIKKNRENGKQLKQRR